MSMLGLLLILLILAVCVAALLLVGTAVIQGYLYSQPVEGIMWRSAAAGAAVAGFFGIWCTIEARAPGQFETLLDFSPSKPLKFDAFWSERTNDGGKKEILYTRSKDSLGRVRYYDADQHEWRRLDNGMMTAIIVDENGEKHRFDAEMSAPGAFKIEENRPLRYVEKDGGRVMSDDMIGEIPVTRYGVLFGNLLLNFAHLLVWFLCLWLLLGFQWPHALGLAVGLWLAFGLAVWPVLRTQVTG